MSARTVQRPVYRVPPSKYWAQYWSPWPILVVATLQLIMTFGTVSMEIGNAVVDLYRSNVFSGFWSFPFMISATIAMYACVCATRTQTKAIIVLILQIITMIIMIIVIGFLMAFIGTNYTLCLGFQCSLNSSTSFSSTTYLTLKQAFITSELVCSVIYFTLSIIYIVLFIKCYQKLPRIHPLVPSLPIQSATIRRQLSTLSRTSRHSSVLTATTYYRSDITEQIPIGSSSALSYSGAQKVCPNCNHVSPYIPHGNLVKCPNCKYQSPLVEHAQQG